MVENFLEYLSVKLDDISDIRQNLLKYNILPEKHKIIIPTRGLKLFGMTIEFRDTNELNIIPKNENRFKYLMMKLAEESAEVGQIAAKCQLFGFDSRKTPDSKTNKELLIQEINDFNAIVQMLNIEFDLNYFRIEHDAATTEKINRVNKYYKEY